MKFVLNNLPNSKVRLGKISGISRLPELILNTPLLLLNSKGGSIPHITHEVLQYLTTEYHGIQVSLPSTIQCSESLMEYKKGIAHFIGLQDHLIYCSVQDPALLTPTGYNAKSSVSVWSSSGRIILDPNKYMDIMEAYQPDIYQLLCDGDTNTQSTKKRCLKAVDNTLNMSLICLDRHKNSQILNSKGVFAVIEGGYNPEARKKCVTALENKPVHGFVIDGLHNNGPDVEYIDFKLAKSILQDTLNLIPKDKLRIIQGSWKPENILELIEMGIDIFDSSLCFTVTERFCAMIFKFEPVDWEENSGTEKEGKEYNFEICLKDDKFREDFNPLLDGCTCLTCTKHTRAYIHHLVMAKELLASVLLMLHNLHHFITFFKGVREAGETLKRVRIK